MKTIIPLIEKARNSLFIPDITVIDAVLHDMADALIDSQDIIIKLNRQDVLNGNAMHLSPSAMDRLSMSGDKINQLASTLRALANAKEQPVIRDKNNVPIPKPSLLAIVYESRPHLTAEAACYAFKAGHGMILRGGKEAFHTNTALASILCDVLSENGLLRELITLIPTSDRVSMTELISLNQLIDYVIPCGSEGLHQYISNNSKIPLLASLEGMPETAC